MTLDDGSLKTNEFQRRRTLRLQQVREQSKDIAKKIRQRAKIEKLRHVLNVDSKKEKEYFECQEKFVKRLEQIYSENLKNVGTAHSVADNQQKETIEKRDLSKLRGKEAAADLKRRKQEKLDEQKKLLDRKLKAREAANELSREKSSTIIKNLAKNQTKKSEDEQNKTIQIQAVTEINTEKIDIDRDALTTNEMATQWESPEEPTPTTFIIPENKNDNTDTTKKLNLFALSDEMTLNINEGLSSGPDMLPTKSSLNLVSEYLQNRTLRLRQPETTKRKPAEDLQRIKQTILQTRATKADGYKQKSFRSTETEVRSEDSLNRKSSVTVYNDSTRDLRCMPCGDSKLVHREKMTDDDAYAQAYKEMASANDSERDKSTKQQQDLRHKIAVKKQNVDKEYRETLSFLNSLTKEVSESSIKPAYVDEEQQKLQRERHQKKLQEEFKKVQKESCKHSCKHTRKKVIMSDRSPSKSPNNVEHELRNKEFQYSWMPVPESDGSLAIHTLPTTTKDKSNTVKFSQVNSYHEYRSRHKHTPPTKDNNNPTKRVVETVVVEENNESTDDNDSNSPSETSSVTNLHINKDNESSDRLSDADKIIIYKILNSRKGKKAKEKKFQLNKQLSNKNHVQGQSSIPNGQDLREFIETSTHDQVKEGIYKADNNNGDNIDTACSNVLQRDNTTSKTSASSNSTKICDCGSDLKKIKEPSMELRKDGGDNGNMPTKSCDNCKIVSDHNFAASSTSSFKTAVNANRGDIHDDGLLRLLDDAGQESSKFYIGASGFLKDNNYEVIIQLRKKEDDKENKSTNLMQQALPAQTEALRKNNLNRTQTESEKDIAISSKNNMIFEEKAGIQDSEVQNIETIKATKLTDNNGNNIKTIETEPVDKINTCDKGVDTSLENSVAIPEHVPQEVPVLKPGTSTYTQTSFYSPIPRPPLMHLSSSTSTAYLSPPDVILPQFLRQNYDPTSEDVYDSSNSLNNEQYEHRANKLGTDCRRKHCNCNKKKSDLKVLLLNKKIKSRRSVTATPPNTCRNSYKSESEELQTHKISKQYECHRQHRRKCSSRGETTGKKCNKTRRRPSTISADSTKVASLKNIVTGAYSQKKVTKSCLNPVVKQYVDKLISINKVGLKAIEIINQDCSEVTTPSNSIINVPSNIVKSNPLVESKISLEQIKNVLKEEIIKSTQNQCHTKTKYKNQPKMHIPKRTIQTIGKKRSIHKVKSLNISKRVLKNNSAKTFNSQQSSTDFCRNKKSTASSNNEQHIKDNSSNESNSLNVRKERTSSPVSKKSDIKNVINSNKNPHQNDAVIRALNKNTNIEPKTYCHKKSFSANNRATARFISSESESNDRMTSYSSLRKEPYDISSQTNDIIGNDINYIKIAEDKLHNIEKIADLTVKCSKRLSNLGKVLEEVRRNKTLVYSQISSNEISSGSDSKSDTSVHKGKKNSPRPNNELVQNEDVLKSPTEISGKDTNKKDSFEFVQLLKDIPKPSVLKTSSTSNIADNENNVKPSSSSEHSNLKCRPKPPPALTRHLKHGQEIFTTPHELSTVVEVDSPMSIKMKSQSSRHTINYDKQEQTKIILEPYTDDSFIELNIDKNQNYILTSKSKKSRTDSSDDSKIKLMDMKQFNDIMLKPFITLQEYAKQYKIDSLDDGSNIEEVLKELPINDVISNSENSLPDVMAELIKRNVISEPFKFESTSNNSTSLSSESTLPILALTKGQKKKKLTDAKPKLQESSNETSESVSMSSNPDLENAFQKLGMGWASSTLKKTKERLALTSSSSTSSTSMRKFNIKSFNLEVPDLGTDSISSLMSIKDDSKKTSQLKVDDNLKNAVQQTSATQSMTVKEFLTQELAKKITFNDSNTKVAEDFVSLYETKMPEEIKNIETTAIKDEHSVNSANSLNNNRARTSTPVQIFKSTTYRSSSSSNTSNGLFSNADDLSSVKVTSNSLRNHSTSDKEDLTIPNYSLKLKKSSDLSKSD